jgi:uncharacterized HAD superfamily protein
MNKEVVMVDIDGTIADNEHRVHHYHNKDWLTFFAEAIHDTPIMPVIRIIQALARDHAIVICTARPEHLREDTEEWLVKYNIPFDALYMRPDKDFRPDNLVKPELVEVMKADGYHPFVAFEDRKRVAEALRAIGIPVMHVAEGDY